MKTLSFIAVVLMSANSYAQKQVVGVIANCDCIESTVDGQRSLGKISNLTPATTEQGARNQAQSRCNDSISEDHSSSITNCQYIKAIDEKIGKATKRRIEKIQDDEENNLANDLLGTL